MTRAILALCAGGCAVAIIGAVSVAVLQHVKTTMGLSRRYAHDGCSAARTVAGGPAEVA